MRRLARVAPACGLAATLAVAAGFIVVLANRPEVMGILTNADLLLPASFASDLIRHGMVARHFQLPRVSSLVPDIATVLLLQGLLGGWRLAMLGYAVAAFMALMTVGGAIAAQLAGRSLAIGTATVLALTAALLGVLWPLGTVAVYLMVLVPAIHSGPFILALAALLLARTAAQPERPGGGRLALLGAMAAAGTLSDKMFLGAFLPPLLTALGMSVWLGQMPRRPALRVAATALAGVAVGWIADRRLFSGPLLRQPDLDLDWSGLPNHIGGLLRQPMLPYLALAVLLVLLPPLLAWRRTPARVFWWTAIATMLPAFLGLSAILWADDSSVRYMQPVFWLPLFAAAGLLLTAPLARRNTAVLATATVAALAGWVVLQPWPRPAILTWQNPLVACLRQAHARGLLHDGLAGYWNARPIEASSDWSLQVDQITPNGDAYLWGNNRFWYQHARDDPAKPPNTDFIVASQLDAPAITKLYGAPAAVLPCPGSEVWLYPPGHLHPVLRDVSLEAFAVTEVLGPMCLAPGAFFDRTGRVAAPIQMPADARTPTVASFGPYLKLPAGGWRLALRYRLASPGGGARWEATSNTGKRQLATGPLPATGNAAAVVETHLDLKQPVVNLELRSLLGPGDRLELLGAEITPDGDATHVCDWPPL